MTGPLRRTRQAPPVVAEVVLHVQRLGRAIHGLRRAEAALRPPPGTYAQAGARRLPPLVELHGTLELALVDHLLPALGSLRRELCHLRYRAWLAWRAEDSRLGRKA